MPTHRRHHPPQVALWMAAVLWAVFALYGCDSATEEQPPIDDLTDPTDAATTPDTTAVDVPPWCGELACSASQACCDGACVDPQTAPSHCGGCGVTCGAGEVCIGGRCACSNGRAFEICSEDAQTCCSGIGCVDVASDPLHCGRCLRDCGVGEVCEDGLCACGALRIEVGFACGASQICCGDPPSCHSEIDEACRCGAGFCGAGQVCCLGDDGLGNEVSQCVRTDRDEAHCGTCGVECAAGQGCIGGHCSCDPEREDCDNNPKNGCEAPLRVDRNNCGGCGVACAPGEVCDGLGLCELRCQPHLEQCDNLCTDLSQDRAHCGTCDTACAPGEVCDGYGLCALSCQTGLTQCEDACANTLFMVEHCGGCGSLCGPGEVCDGAGRCALSCQPGRASCGGWCVELGANRWHCGACGASCPPGQVCDGAGQCALQCLPGRIECGGECVNPQTNSAHCGACGQRCAAGTVCEDGLCVPNCPSGALLCAGGCVDPLSDRLHCGDCGVACGPFEACTQGACVPNCPAGQTMCSFGAVRYCISTQSNNSHCGACGAACPSNTYCLDGLCVGVGVTTQPPPSEPCGADKVWCGDICADLTSNDAHCGACGAACTPQERCAGGTCEGVCVAPYAQCGGLCVDPSSDPLHCGACFAACVLGETCSDGVCEMRCASGLTSCQGVCVDTQSNSSHCGDCDQPCAAVEVCVNGACACPSGLDPCGGGCVDTDTNTSHCGACDQPCAPGEACIAGVCDSPGHVAAGGSTTCWDLNQQAQCVGSGYDGRRGDGCSVFTCSASETPNTVLNLTEVKQLAVGQQHTCARRADGTAWCWGSNSYQNLSDGTFNLSSTPVQVQRSDGQPLTQLIQLSIGAYHTCALQQGGIVWCWGYNGSLQTGAPSSEFTTAARQVADLPQAAWVDAGAGSSCAVSTQGQVWCWGDNSYGQLARNPSTFFQSAVPVMISGIGGAVQVAVGQESVCALLANGEVWCWGSQTWSQLGNNHTNFYDSTPLLTPTRAQNLVGATALAAGSSFYCALREQGGQGEVWCWGNNIVGQIGQPLDLDSFGTPRPALIPTQLVGLPSAVSINLGLNHATARLADGQVACWGDNTDGQCAYTRVDPYFSHTPNLLQPTP